MYQRKWYLSTWVIALCFAFSFYGFPAIIGLVLLILQMKEDKKIKQDWENSGFGDTVQTRHEKERLEKEQERIKAQGVNVQAELHALNQEIARKKNEIIVLDEEILMQSFGFYKPKYGFDASDLYEKKLELVRKKQKYMVKEQIATDHRLDWTIGNDKKKGREFILDTIKLTLRAFNNECDNIIMNVKYNNLSTSEKRINKVYEDLNKLTDMQHVSITREYLKLKLEELYLKYEFEQKKQEEKEEQQAIKERMREEAKVLKELEKAREKIEKEEKHFAQAIANMNQQLENAKDEERENLLAKLKELEAQLAEVKQNKEDLLYREQNTRAGYVYVISNIGSFGENVYKIGMTRRLEPMDRVKELGDASVPFTFDVHAMIFSEDAPTLENALHRSFASKRVNLVNERKEFFKVSLQEIEDVVKRSHNKTVEFTKLAEAEEYRKTLQLHNQPEKVAQPV